MNREYEIEQMGEGVWVVRERGSYLPEQDYGTVTLLADVQRYLARGKPNAEQEPAVRLGVYLTLREACDDVAWFASVSR